MNAANEVAVQKFLAEEISFLEISNVIEKTMQTIAFVAQPTLDDLVHTHSEAIAFAKTL
jgi:1-deoxy-D-xylulose-5-phosphate reductoisomerase